MEVHKNNGKSMAIQARPCHNNTSKEYSAIRNVFGNGDALVLVAYFRTRHASVKSGFCQTCGPKELFASRGFKP
jgi:hypothetical protein